MQTEKLQLTFGRNSQLRFNSEKDFFKMLGVLCKPNGQTVIVGRVTDFMQFYKIEDGTPFRASELPEGSREPANFIERGSFLGSVIDSFQVVFSEQDNIPDAFANLVKGTSGGNRVSCAEYVRYLMDDFGAYMHCAYRPNNAHVTTIKLPPADEVKKLMIEKGYEDFLDFFEKGLKS